jgi:hypothetical protein
MKSNTYVIVDHVSARRTFDKACARITLQYASQDVKDGKIAMEVYRVSKANHEYLMGVRDAINDLCQ